MMNKAFTGIIFLVLLHLFAIGQNKSYPQYPDSYFQDPLDIPLRLSGSFGELRGGHFHSGIDLKTYGKTGLPLYSAAEGYVARIKVSSSGFGKALYINHPNGYTTVYAHIARFNKDIARFVEKVQYERETYELNLFPNEKKFQVKKGDLIAYSGNSGSSEGPHLHFEVRESKTEKPVNPLFFGFDVVDSRYPIIKGIRLYPLGEHSEIKVRFNHHQRKQVVSHGDAITLDVENEGNRFYFEHVADICATGKVGVGVEVYDYHEKSSNPLGVYNIKLKEKKSNKLVYESTIDKFRFAETRYINAHIDYAAKIRRNATYQRCYVLPGNQLPFYKTSNQGKIEVSAANAPEMKMVISDTYGNKAKLEWNFNYLEEFKKITSGSSKDNHEVIMPHGQPNKFERDGIELNFPKGAFYDTVNFTFKKRKGQEKGMYSPVYQVHDRYTPVHKYYEMAIDASGVPEQYRNKALIAYEDEEGGIEAEGGEYKNGFITTKVRSLGPFHLRVDTIGPLIRPLNFSKGTPFSGNIPMRILIEDNLAGVSRYNPEIDGEWVRMAYDEKNDLLLFKDFHRLKSGDHVLKLEVFDDQGNRSVYRTTFKKL